MSYLDSYQKRGIFYQGHRLFYTTINFEKGAFAVNTLGDLYASTDYTSYIIDTTIAIPEYLFLSLRCRLFMEYVASVKPKGMKTRARYEFIKNFEIPVPPIPTQEALLRAYHETLNKAEKSTQNGNDFSANLLYDIQSKVADLKQETIKKSKNNTIMHVTPFTSTTRWEVEYVLKEGRLENLFSCLKNTSARSVYIRRSGYRRFPFLATIFIMSLKLLYLGNGLVP